MVYFNKGPKQATVSHYRANTHISYSDLKYNVLN